MKQEKDEGGVGGFATCTILDVDTNFEYASEASEMYSWGLLNLKIILGDFWPQISPVFVYIKYMEKGVFWIPFIRGLVTWNLLLFYFSQFFWGMRFSVDFDKFFSKLSKNNLKLSEKS